MDEIFLVLTFMGCCHWPGRPLMDESGVELFPVSSVAPLSMGRPEKCDFFWTFANELVPRVMVLLVGNHVDLLDRETCHVFPIHLLCRFRCQGPLLINSWFLALPSSFLKFPSSSSLVLDLCLEVSCVHSFSLVLDPGIFLSSSLVF